MFSVRLSDLRHTTSFRTGVLFAAMFGAASFLLFGFVYSQTFGYLAHEVDGWLVREIAGRASVAAGELEQTLDARATAEPDMSRTITLFGSDGHWLAGDSSSLPASLPTSDRPFQLRLQRNGADVPFLGMIHRLDSGEILLVARDMRDVEGFRATLLNSFLWAGGIALLLALAGAAITGMGALGRIDRVARTIERIVSGRLNERLPSDGRGGDLDRLIDVVNRMLDEIERLMQEVKGVTEDIAHDLRTPLTRLLAGLERVRRRGTTVAEYEAAIDETIAEAKEILATFSALLRIAEVESGARRAGFRPLDLITVARDVSEFYEPVAEEKHISLLLDAAGLAGAEIIGDPNLLFEALSNLVENAIKYSPTGSRVIVSVFATENNLGVEVRDNGPGIPIEERNAVLRRFHRLDKSRTAPGSGLGLSLVAAVARLHDLQFAIGDASPGCSISLVRDKGRSQETRIGSIEAAGASSSI